MILHGDCLDLMAEMEPNSVDAIVTDPPYELGFMGKKWDGTGIAFDPATWEACLRVLKPGGHLVAFSGTRTSHRMVCAIEDAGFEIRDSLVWLYGSGFPKSLDVSKQIDKAAGAEREVIGRKSDPRYKYDFPESSRPYQGKTTHDWTPDQSSTMANITAPATPEAEQWQGWHTALKPGHEPICLARKPLSGTVAQTVLAYGTGAINVDACRIDSTENLQRLQSKTAMFSQEQRPWKDRINQDDRKIMGSTSGRWPANVILDETAAALLDAMSGERKSGSGNKNIRNRDDRNAYGKGLGAGYGMGTGGDTGGASRFFYCAKSSRSERNAGLDGMPERFTATMGNGIGVREHDPEHPRAHTANHHPTVKPLSLMRWLVRLVCPPGGVILDPFAGSGSTGCAAALEGFDFIGIEREAEYVEIARARIAHWTPKPAPQLALTLEAIAGD